MLKKYQNYKFGVSSQHFTSLERQNIIDCLWMKDNGNDGKSEFWLKEIHRNMTNLNEKLAVLDHINSSKKP